MGLRVDANEFRSRCAQARAKLLRAAEEPDAVQETLLASFLRTNESTAFGREHGFAQIRDSRAFRAAVPIHTYESLSGWIERSAAGETQVLTSEAPAMFFRTAGTTGTPKKIPVTRSSMRLARGPAMYALWGNFLAKHPEMLEHDDAMIDLHWDRRPYGDRLAGIPIQSMAQRQEALDPEDFAAPWYDAPWFRPRPDVPEYFERLYAKLNWFSHHDARGIASINPMTLLLFGEVLARNVDRLLVDIHDGRGFEGRPPNPARAAELSAAAKRNGGCLLPRDIWPRLAFIGCRKSAAAASYVPKLRELFGDDVDIVPYSTAGAEGSQVIPVDAHPTAGIVALCSAFFEFLPTDEPWTADNPTLLARELERDREYQTVVTTGDGLYRYAVGDIFRVVGFVGFVGPTPQLEYVGRVGRTSSLVGESVTEPQILDVVIRASEAFGSSFSMFTCCPRRTPTPHYSFLVEYAGDTEQRMAVALARAIDEALSMQNPSYRGHRKSGALAAASVELLKSGTFVKYWTRAVAAGRGTVQLQIQPLQKDDAVRSALMAEPNVV